MDEGKEVIYTDSAKERLADLEREFRSKIEAAVLEAKRVPGEQVVEVTGADLERVWRDMRITLRTQRERRERMLLSFGSTYLLVGLIATAFSFALRIDFRGLHADSFVLAMGVVVATVGMALLGMLLVRRFAEPSDDMSNQVRFAAQREMAAVLVEQVLELERKALIEALRQEKDWAQQRASPSATERAAKGD